jgi:RecA-family ATPase
VDLSDPAERLQMAGELRPPHRDPDTVIALAERAYHASAQKTRSAEDRDQRFLIRCHEESFLGSYAGLFLRFAIRDHFRPVQDICPARCLFDKRATDP